jgi:hypothetical protein
MKSLTALEAHGRAMEVRHGLWRVGISIIVIRIRDAGT